MVMIPDEADIDRGADALREHEQGGKKLRQWADLPKSTKDKWRAKAIIVLESALLIDL